MIDRELAPTIQETYGVPRESYEDPSGRDDPGDPLDPDESDESDAEPQDGQSGRSQSGDGQGASQAQEGTEGTPQPQARPDGPAAGGDGDGAGDESEPPFEGVEPEANLMPMPAESRPDAELLPDHVESRVWGYECTECGARYDTPADIEDAKTCCATQKPTYVNEVEDNGDGADSQDETELSEAERKRQYKAQTVSKATSIPMEGGSYTDYPGGGTDPASRPVAGRNHKATRQQERARLHGDGAEDHEQRAGRATVCIAPPLRDAFKNDRGGLELDYLIENGYITEHKLSPTITYTVEPKGKNLLGESDRVRAGIGIGDRGDGMPHRFGADLAVEWLAAQPDIDRIGSFTTVTEGDEEIIDIAGLTETDGEGMDIKTLVEVEGGRSLQEAREQSSLPHAGSHDYDSFAKDYKQLAALAESDKTVDEGFNAVWVIRNGDIAENVFTALANRDCLQTDASTLASAASISNATLNDAVETHGGPGMTAVYTFGALRTKL